MRQLGSAHATVSSVQYDNTLMTCGVCGEPFMVSGGVTGPMIDRESIDCPHCGASNGGARIADVYLTRKLTAEETLSYAKAKGKA